MDQKDKLAEAKKALLAKRLKAKKSAGSTPKSALIQRLTHTNPVPLSLAQQRFWVTHQLDQTKASHNFYDGWRITGQLDYDALQWAFGQLVERQPILRTKIKLIDGVPHQASYPAAYFRFSLINEFDQTTVDAAIQSKISKPFDLESDQLVRLHLYQLDEGQADHIILLTIHHIISDEYSNALFWEELGQLYGIATGERPDREEELSISYRDYSEWQIKWLADKAGAKQLDYWRTELAGEITSLQLPHDRARTSAPSGRGGMISRNLPAELSDRVSALSKKTNATPFMIWMAIFHTLLYRYTNQADVWVGTPIGNRQRPEVKRLIGLFLNTIVIRSHVDPQQPFSQLLKQIQTKALTAFGNQDIPFDQVVNALAPERETGLTPLFQTMLVYSPPPKSPDFGDLAFEKVSISNHAAKLDLTLFVMGGDRPKASIQYSSDIFEPDTIDRMLGHLELLATSILSNPETPLTAVPLLTAPEKEQILVEWNAPQVAPDASGKLLHSLILAHAKTKFSHPAVIGGEKTISYRELDLQSGNLARTLQSMGVNGKANPMIGVMIDRRPEMLTGILAILRAGGAYVPIDPDYPAERIEHIIIDADLDIILTAGVYSLPGSIERPVELIDLTQPIPEQAPADLGQIAPPSPDSLAYVIYTSGSTGKPKGVMVTHSNIVHSTIARYAFYEHPAERFLLLSSFAFDSSMVGIFWTLCQGGTLILPEQGMHQNVSWLNKTIEQKEVTHLLALPSLYQILLEESEADQLKSLSTVMVAGEACHAGLVADHYQQLPTSTLYNEYGPTEGTVWSHAYKFPKDFSGGAVPIGRNIPNVSQYILDTHQQPVPVGVGGELVIGGAGITAGYLNRADLTAEKFINLPHLAKTAEERFYRTGDLVKWRKDGNIVFLGRVDHQVKIRGFRVELGEIEAALINHPAIKLGAVKAVTENGPSHKKLVAWFTADQPLDPAKVKQKLSNALPDYMVPAELVQLDEMPLAPNGKVDRKALIPPKPSVKSSQDTGHIEPTTESEQKLQKIWQSALNIESISTLDNFFDLGGHSLLAIKLFSKIEKEIGTVLPLATIFQFPTISDLARKLDQDQEALSLKEQLLVPIQPKGDKEPLFLIHDGAGYVYQYERLLPAMGKDRPLYGIIPPDWDGRRRVKWNLEEMVENYTALIKSVQPAGPYHLSGFSLGGVLAFEIACKLQKAGDKVGLVSLIEPTPWNPHYLFKGDPNKGGTARHLENLGQLDFRQKVIYVGESTYGRGNIIFQAVAGPIFEARLNRYPDRVPRRLRDGYYIGKLSLELLENYTPSKFDGNLHLFMMDRGPLVDGTLGWDSHNVGKTTLNILNTRNHSKLIEVPYITQIGETITDQLKTEDKS